MPAPKDYKAVRDVLRQYMDGCVHADIDLLKKVFHPDATLSHNDHGKAVVTSMQPFYDELLAGPSAKDSDKEYMAEIGFIHITGHVASASIIADNLMEMNYMSHFHLLKTDGAWQIVGKTYAKMK